MEKRTITLIAAVSLDGSIGDGTQMLWKLPEDLKHFKDTTSGHVVIMGRKTFDSLDAKPLPGRINIVITSSVDDVNEVDSRVLSPNTRLFFVSSPLGALALVMSLTLSDEEIFVIGGSKIYNEFLPIARKIILTHVHTPVQGIKFPPFSQEKFKPVQVDHRFDASIPFSIVTYAWSRT